MDGVAYSIKRRLLTKLLWDWEDLMRMRLTMQRSRHCLYWVMEDQYDFYLRQYEEERYRYYWFAAYIDALDAEAKRQYERFLRFLAAELLLKEKALTEKSRREKNIKDRDEVFSWILYYNLLRRAPLEWAFNPAIAIGLRHPSSIPVMQKAVLYRYNL